MEARSSALFGTIAVSTRERSAPRPGPIGQYRVELRSGTELASLIDDWRALLERSLDPNLFAGPEVVVPALQHLPDGRNVVVALVW